MMTSRRNKRHSKEVETEGLDDDKKVETYKHTQ